MPRNMSFSMSVEAVRNRTKTVTRRLAWWDLEPGTILCAVEKAQGLKKGEKVKRLGYIRVLRADWEPLQDMHEYGSHETTREGFPGMGINSFIDMFCRANKCEPEDWVNRIEFEYVEEEA